jgi:hypothetical protein
VCETGAHPLFEGSVVLFRGCGARAVREWVAQCHGVDTGPYSGGDGLTRRVGGTTPGYDSQVVSETWRGFILDLGACMCQNIKCPGWGAGVGGGEPARASSEAEPHPRGRAALERGGVSPEGVSRTRARRRFVSAVQYASSKMEFHPRGAGAIYSGGPLRPLGLWAPATGP